MVVCRSVKRFPIATYYEGIPHIFETETYEGIYTVSQEPCCADSHG